MQEMELEISAAQLRDVKRLAKLHYGDDGDEALGKVVEIALQMRLLWLDIAGEIATRVEEPLIDLQVGTEGSEHSHEEIAAWLFEGGDSID